MCCIVDAKNVTQTNVVSSFKGVVLENELQELSFLMGMIINDLVWKNQIVYNR